MSFELQNVTYEYLHSEPSEAAQYGLAITFWHTNVNDLIFFLHLVKQWLNSDKIEISVCSHARLNDDQLKEVSGLANYVVWCQQDLGHQNGTTAHANGAIWPLWSNEKLKTITHTDADTIILNDRYFFGNAQILIDSGKLLLTSGPTYLYAYEEQHLYKHIHSEPCTFTQFGAVFTLNRAKVAQTNYFPLAIRGHFETDRYTWFEECGLSVANDVIMLPRLPHLINSCEVAEIDTQLGVMHSTNCPADKKIKLLRLLCYDKWEGMRW